VTAQEVLVRVLEAGGKVIPDPDRPRLLVPPALKPLVLEHREVLRQMLRARRDPGAAYRQALWHLWTLPPDAPRSAYDQALAEVLLQEAMLPPLEAQATHREEARKFHRQTGRCPFCQEEGELHLPDEKEDAK